MKDTKSNKTKLLEIPGYTFLLATRFLFILAAQMQFTLISWEIYHITKDVLYIGYTSLAELLPAFILAFYGGYIVDKYDRKKIFLLGLSSSLATSIVLFMAICFRGENIFLVWAMMFVVFCSGIFRVFLSPAQTALVGEIVPKNLYAKATTWFSASWQIAIVIGPPIAGGVYASLGIKFAQMFIIICVFVSVILVNFIKRKPTNLTTNVHNTFWESAKTGWKFVLRTKEILASFTLDMFAVLFGGAVSMLPVFAKEIYHVDAKYLGWLRSAVSMGTISILLFLSIYPLRKKQGIILLISVCMFGVTMILFGATTSYMFGFIMLALSGIFDGVSVNVRSTILQVKTPDAIKGKVAAVGTLFVMSSNELGSFESSLAAKILGLSESVIFGGIATIIVVIVVYFLFPQLKKMNY